MVECSTKKGTFILCKCPNLIYVHLFTELSPKDSSSLIRINGIYFVEQQMVHRNVVVNGVITLLRQHIILDKIANQ